MKRPGKPYVLTLLTGLYVAQGLPYGFFTQALPVLMREAGLSLKAISLTSVLFLPWVFKFLWAPFVDGRGSARGWLVPLQFGAAAAAGLLALANLQSGFGLIFAAVFAFNVLAAVQDVVTDGLAVRLLDSPSRGLGNGIQVGAYRLGMVFGGGLLLYVYARLGWTTMWVAMSAMLLLCALPTLWLAHPSATKAEHAARPPLKQLAAGSWLRLRTPGVFAFLLLVCGYKFGDSMASSVVSPFMKDLGMSKESIAIIKGTLGSSAGLAGAVLGGLFAYRFGRRSALLVCGLLQTASILFYLAASLHIGGEPMVWAACIAEHLLGGMATVALFALMMDAAELEHASTDYSLYACAIVVTQMLANFAGAIIGDAVGYVPVFASGFVLSGIGCLLLVFRLDRGGGPSPLALAWPRAATAAT